jgi:hypothetical protein
MAPPAPPWRRAHAPHRLARAQQAADDVDVEHAAPARHAHARPPRGHVDHAGVVDQARQPAQLGVDVREHAQHLRLVGHVGLHRDGVAAVARMARTTSSAASELAV